MKKKLAVFFPGRRYGVDCPLLYYAESICREKGYDTLLMHYSEYRDKKDMITIEENIRQTLSYIMSFRVFVYFLILLQTSLERNQ